MSALAAMALIMTMMWGGAMAQSGCTSALMGLTPCLGFIQGGSINPSSSCCSGLASVVKNQAACLCQVLNGGGSSFGVTINQTQALALPGACKVQSPPVSACNGKYPPVFQCGSRFYKIVLLLNYKVNTLNETFVIWCSCE